MFTNKLHIPLEKKTDVDKKTFYLGKIQFPGVVDFTNGVAILVFISDEGEEEIQIGNLRHSYPRNNRPPYAQQPQQGTGRSPQQGDRPQAPHPDDDDDDDSYDNRR